MNSVQRYLIVGALTITPLWITFLVLRFILQAMAGVSMPAVRRALPAVDDYLPWLGALIHEAWFQWSVALLATFLLLLALGWVASNVAGRRLVGWFDRNVMRIPLVERIYGSSRQLLEALQSKPKGVQRVVLIEFPQPGMRTVGLVTRMLRDANTGEALAAVYVPTTPNPTSGYLEIVPRDQLVDTDWTLDEAMSFVISGGTVAPEEVSFRSLDERLRAAAGAASRPAPDGPSDAA